MLEVLTYGLLIYLCFERYKNARFRTSNISKEIEKSKEEIEKLKIKIEHLEQSKAWKEQTNYLISKVENKIELEMNNKIDDLKFRIWRICDKIKPEFECHESNK